MCNLAELTITGMSSTPFNYDETDVTAWYGGPDQPWTHPNQTERFGASSGVNYQRINKLPTLRTGKVAVLAGTRPDPMEPSPPGVRWWR